MSIAGEPGRNPLFEGLGPMDEDVASLLPMAEMLRDAVYRRLYPTGQTELTLPSVDNMFDRAMSAVMERLIELKLDDLTPLEFAEAYTKVQGDEALITRLNEVKAVRQKELERTAELAKIHFEAKTAGRLRLAALPVDEVVSIGLYDSDHPELASKEQAQNIKSRPLHRIIQCRLINPEEGKAEILHDTWYGAVWSDAVRGPGIEPLSKGTLGSRRVTLPDEPIVPIINIHAPILFRSEQDELFAPPQIVGYVETLDHTLLLNGN